MVLVNILLFECVHCEHFKNNCSAVILVHASIDYNACRSRLLSLLLSRKINRKLHLSSFSDELKMFVYFAPV